METLKSSGTFTDISCPRLLVHLHLSRFSGTLRISQGAFLKLLYLQTGEIAMASSNDQGDHLAPILMRAGKLKSEQLELARKQTGPGTSLARVLVQMGFLTSGELFAGARQQLRQIVGSVLGLGDGRYEILGDYFPREITSLNVDTRELLLDLISELPERSFVLLEVGAPDSIYFPVPPDSGDAAVSLPRTWRGYADRFTRAMTIRAFGQAAGLDDFAASKAVYGLHLFGLLEPRSEEPEGVAVPVKISTGEAALEEAAPGEIPVTESADTPEPGAPRASSGPDPVEESGAEYNSRVTAPELSEPPPTSPPPDDAAAPPITSTERPRVESWPVVEKPAAGEEILAQGRPIRLEFKEAHPPDAPPVRSFGPWGVLSVIAGFAILAVAFTWFVFLRDSSAPGGLSPATQGEPGVAPPPQEAPQEAAPSPAETETVSGEMPEAGGAGADQAALETEAPSAEEEEKTPAGPAERASAAMPGPTAPATSGVEPGTGRESSEKEPVPPTVPQESPGQEAAPKTTAAAPPFAAAARFFEARAHLDAGDAVAASAAWLDLVRDEREKVFTLQIAIACQQESVKKAARRTRGSPDFFTVPFLLQGRSCYRFCWGAYPTEAAAQAGKPAVPEFFLSEGGKPVVVRLSKLAPPEQR